MPASDRVAGRPCAVAHAGGRAHPSADAAPAHAVAPRRTRRPRAARARPPAQPCRVRARALSARSPQEHDGCVSALVGEGPLSALAASGADDGTLTLWDPRCRCARLATGVRVRAHAGAHAARSARRSRASLAGGRRAASSRSALRGHARVAAPQQECALPQPRALGRADHGRCVCRQRAARAGVQPGRRPRPWRAVAPAAAVRRGWARGAAAVAPVRGDVHGADPGRRAACRP